MTHARAPLSIAFLSIAMSLGLSACGDDEPAAAPPSAPLTSTPVVPTAMTRDFVVDSASSNVEFRMQAPLESIRGHVPGAAEGRFTVDLANLANSRGVMRVDLDRLEVFQQKREAAGAELGEETKNETQNEHLRAWLEIGEDAPPDVRETNRWAELSIVTLDALSESNVLAMTGATRTVQARVRGSLRVHGRAAPKSARVELTFAFEGNEPTSVRIRTLEPFLIGLDEFDVRPRTAFGRLARQTLAALGEKVAEAAPITIDATANVEPAPAAAAP